MTQSMHRSTGAFPAADQRAQFVRDALDALSEMDESGLGYAADDVHAYLMDRAHGRHGVRPPAVDFTGSLSAARR